MAGIPSEFIDQLLERIDIVDVISSRITLKKAGKDFQALCPFHTENTPSFTVSQHKQFYHCFGCGKHGSAIGFLMDYEGMEFVDCVQVLAQSVGLEVPKGSGGHFTNKSSNLFEVTNKAQNHFATNFKKNHKAQEYMEQRGVSKATLDTFQVGFAQNTWDGLMKQFPQSSQSDLMKAGLLAENDNGKIYDKFRNRIIFPIQDRRGRVIAFGGRAIEADQKPKYLNSPETPLFHKGRELYGLNLAKKHSNEKFIIIVEGYMDVIALHEAGIKNSVATLGTATSHHHIVTLLRAYDRIVFCFDGDSAGQEAAWKALQISLPLYRDDKTLQFLFLPDNHDPDTYIKDHGVQAFQKQIENAHALSRFLLERLKSDLDLNSIDGRAMFIDRARKHINQIPKGQFKKLLNEEVEKITQTEIRIQETSTQTKIWSLDKWTPIRKAITFLVQNPSLVSEIPSALEIDKINQNGAKILSEIVDFCSQNPHISTAVLLENFKTHSAYEHLAKLAVLELELNDSQKQLEMLDIARFLERKSVQAQIQELKEKQAQSGLTSEEKNRLMELLSNQLNKI